MGLSNEDRRGLLVRLEAAQRSLFALSHTWLADLMGQRGLDDIYGSMPVAVAVVLGVSQQRARQRIRYANQFGARSALTGERLGPVSSATAAAASEGVLDEEHQDIVRKFFQRLGSKVDVETLESAERQLAQLARDLLPDHFKVAARRLYDTLDPDGSLSEDQVADQTYFRFGDQDENGLSRVSGRVDAELRSY
ncbi:DUF222 domain-containing protein, partial [Rhodococcoides yunnanense]|uniref:DUF222 domain-containing protein n=1 Tax=Rhodococcoides yunnanense TaxID=278209 RepID=UPI0014756332